MSRNLSSIQGQIIDRLLHQVGTAFTRPFAASIRLRSHPGRKLIGMRAVERIVQPLGNLLANALHICIARHRVLIHVGREDERLSRRFRAPKIGTMSADGTAYRGIAQRIECCIFGHGDQ